MDILTTLQALNACHGPAGDEGQISAKLRHLAAPFVDECTVDTLGNLIAHKKGSGPKIMFSAHMDSIGLVVTHIDDKGFLRFGRLGGLSPNSLLHAPIRFKNGTCGLVSLDASVKEKDMVLDDMYIDIGAKNEAEASEKVQVGDTAVYAGTAVSAGDRLISPYMDNRISCIVQLMAMERLQHSENDLYFVFTTQEEVGLRGATTAAYAIDPDYGLALDVTIADDEVGSKHHGSSKIGGGAAIKVMDGSVICHPAVVETLTTLAKTEGISYQLDVIRGGGTDAGVIHQTRCGVYTGGISVACRYVHSPVELVDIRDVEACAQLVAAFAATELSLPTEWTEQVL